jgi:hypothetical protein
VRYWGKQKELLKNAKSDSRAFRGSKVGKSAYFTHPDFLAAKLEKKVRKLREYIRYFVRGRVQTVPV